MTECGSIFNRHGLFCTLTIAVKGYFYIFAVNLRDGPYFDIPLVGNLRKPILRKCIEVVAQFWYPPFGCGVHFLIDTHVVLAVSQRFQRPSIPINAKCHFRVIDQIAVLLVGMTDCNNIRIYPLNVQRHHTWAAFQAQITVFAVGDLWEQPFKCTVIQFRP